MKYSVLLRVVVQFCSCWWWSYNHLATAVCILPTVRPIRPHTFTIICSDDLVHTSYRQSTNGAERSIILPSSFYSHESEVLSFLPCGDREPYSPSPLAWTTTLPCVGWRVAMQSLHGYPLTTIVSSQGTKSHNIQASFCFHSVCCRASSSNNTTLIE